MSTKPYRWLELFGSHGGILDSKFSSVIMSTVDAIAVDNFRLYNNCNQIKKYMGIEEAECMYSEM